MRAPLTFWGAAWAAMLLLAAGSLRAQQQPLSARAAVENRRVYVGQSFLYQIQVEGSDSPEKPDLSALRNDFTVEESGGGATNSQSITIVNGRMSRVVQRGYTFNYKLTPKRHGVLTIPSLRVRAGSETLRTNEIRIQVSPPEENEDFRLRMELSENDVYVGQPVNLRVTWYIGGNVDQYNFNVPVLEDERFEFADPRVEVNPARQSDYLNVSVGGRTVVARKGRGRLKDWEYVSVSFEKFLIPRRGGSFRLPSSTVSFRARRSVRGGRGLFDDFFGNSVFNRGRRAYESFSIPSNRPTLKVRPLPERDRPANFSGLIGAFSFEAEAEPREISVGEPITLRVKVSGPEYLDYVRLPPLQSQAALARDFKIPEEMSPGEVEGGVKIFTQTIRAKRAAVERIPALEVNFFDPQQRKYVFARTEPIPIEVKGTRMVTAADAEGLGAEAVMQSELETRKEGIAYNYEDSDALVDQGAAANRLTSPLGLSVLFAPPLGWLVLWGFTAWGRRGADPARRRAQRAFRELQSELAALEGLGDEREIHRRLLDALREYLGARLSLPAAALTFRDVEAKPAVREETLQGLKDLFEQLEAGSYAGGALAEADSAGLIAEARRACKRLEEELRGS